MSATDALSGVAELRYRVDGGPEQRVPNAMGGVTLSADGVHLVSVVAVDRAGNVGEPVTTEVRIDRTAPEPRIDVLSGSGRPTGGVASATDASDAVPSAYLDDVLLIALTRVPSLTHMVLILIGFPGMIAVVAAIEVPINQYVPTMQDILNWLGIDIQFPGSEVLGPLIKHSPWGLAIFAVAITPAICEEVFCRGFLAWGLSGRYTTWAVVLITSFLFGCLHVDPRQGIGAMMLGAAIHGAYVATRSLWAAMFVHFANNGLAVVHYNDQLYPDLLKPLEQILTDSPFLFVVSGLFLFCPSPTPSTRRGASWLPSIPKRPCGCRKRRNSAELPPPGSGTVVTHDPISPVSVVLVLVAAVGFGAVMAFA